MAQDLIRDNQFNRKATADALRRFLEEIIRASGLELKAREILLERGAEVLKAFEHLALRALRLEPAFHEKIHIDCGGYRALHFEELRMTARVAAERVQTSRQPFRLNPMSSRERRIVHLALKSMLGVRTESVGFGEDRQVVIHPADSKPAS
jgi:spoIIIJ-associated protein